MSQLTTDAMYQIYLNHVYHQTSIQFEYTQAQELQFKQQNICRTYGELLYPSIIKIIKALKISDNSTFLDMGSGLGKLALTVFLRSNVQQVIGIEANQKLHLQAAQVLTQVEQDISDLYANDRGVALYCANFLEADLSEVDIVYSCSTCFSKELIRQIGEKIDNASNVRQVISLKPLPALKRLPFKKAIAVECSWDSAIAYYYHNF